MPIRRLLHASVPDARLEAIAEAVRERYGDDEGDARFERLEADNWLSVPIVVDDRWFVKVVGDQHTLLHGLLTAGRNLGALSAGTAGFFERFDTPAEMAEHELDATRRMRELGVAAPAPTGAFEFEGLGVLVLEFLPGYRTLDELPSAAVERLAPALFAALSRLHDGGLGHGDLRAENVLVAPGEDGEETLYFIDATRMRSGAAEDVTAYDLACALAALEPAIGARAAVEAALERYSPSELLAARSFLDFVNLRPDHDFAVTVVKGEIEKAAA